MNSQTMLPKEEVVKALEHVFVVLVRIGEEG